MVARMPDVQAMRDCLPDIADKSHQDILATIAMSGANARLPAGEGSFRMETLNDEVDDIAQSLEARREEPVDREQVREILKREDDMFDSDAPGGMIANLMVALIPPEALAPLRDDSRCAWCAAPPAPGAKLLVCSRCRGAAYCNKSCFKAAWKGGHKQACTTHDERVDELIEIWESRSRYEDHEEGELTRGAADAAVRITGERVLAAYHVLISVLTGGWLGLASDDDIAAGLSLLFGVKNLRAADLHAVEESLSEEKRAMLWARREEVAAEKEAMRQRMAPLVVECGHIYQELTDTMGGCMLLRHQNHPGEQAGPHNSNRDVVDFHFGRLLHAAADDEFAQRFARENRLAEVFIPCFLALAVELLTPPINYEPRANGRRSEAVMRRRHDALRARVNAAWIAYAHAHGDAEDGASDAEILDIAHKRESIFRNKQYMNKRNPLPMFLRPGWWLPKNDFAPPEELREALGGKISHRPTRRQAKMEKRRHQARESVRRAEAHERMKRAAAEARAASR